MHRMTKLRVLENPSNGKTNEDIKKLNDEHFEKLSKLGFISGGNYAIEEGMVHTGSLRDEPKVGEVVFLYGRGMTWFRTSLVKEIIQESKHSRLITTENSLYRLEDVSNHRHLRKWILEIAPNLKKEKTFDEWISGFEDRYSPSALELMKRVWEEA